MKWMIYTKLFGLLLLTMEAHSVEYTKTTFIKAIISEGKRPAYPPIENNDFLELENSTPWSSTSNCNSSFVVLPEGKNFMRSIALAAITAGKAVEIRVDDELPKVTVHCQVVILMISK